MGDFKKVYKCSSDFVKDCMALKSMDYDEYRKYVKIFMKEDPNKYIYEEMNPLSAWSQGNYRYLCYKVNIEDDVVVTFIKWVSAGNIPYGRIINYPISVKGIVQNQNDVMKYLISLPFIKEVLVADGLTRNVVGEVYYNDFYTKVPDRCRKVNTSKWKSKRGINKIRSTFNVEYKRFDDASEALEDMSAIYYRWKDCAVSRGLKPFHNKAELKMLKPDNPYKSAVKVWVMYVDGVPVGYDIVEFFSDRICRVHHNKSVYDGDYELLIRYKDYLMHYLLINELNTMGVEWVYYGFAPEDKNSIVVLKSLSEFKKINFDRCVRYRRIKLQGKDKA